MPHTPADKIWRLTRFFCLSVICLLVGSLVYLPTATAREEASEGKAAILSPHNGFVTNGSTLHVTARFDTGGDHHSKGIAGNVLQLRLLLDGRLVDSFDISPNMRRGTH